MNAVEIEAAVSALALQPFDVGGITIIDKIGHLDDASLLVSDFDQMKAGYRINTIPTNVPRCWRL